tara:strand:- start:2195 stop:2443 length:249 start_codon:yes stop_codon:yes gene_type:complete
MSTPHQVTITGLVVLEDESDPECLAAATLLDLMVPMSVNVSSAPMTAQRRHKRSYRCSICGGRHAANHCPQQREINTKGGAE